MVNLRNLIVQSGFSTTTPVNWIGKVHLRWDEGMNLTNPNYEFQVRRNHIQPILTEPVWWASECVFAKQVNYLGNYSAIHGTDYVKLFNQNRFLGREYQYLNGKLDYTNGTWLQDFDIPNASDSSYGYYYSIGIVNKESGALIEQSGVDYKTNSHAATSNINQFNQGCEDVKMLMMRRPTKQVHGWKSHIYWFMNGKEAGGSNHSTSSSPYKYDYSSPLNICSNSTDAICNKILSRSNNLSGDCELWSPDKMQCGNWQPNTCPPLHHIESDGYCPSIAGSYSAGQNLGPQNGTFQDGSPCPPGEIVGQLTTNGEWWVIKSTSLAEGGDKLGNPQYKANDFRAGSQERKARSLQGFMSVGGSPPSSYSSDGNCGVSGYGPTNYPWWEQENWNDGESWSENEHWVMGARQSAGVSMFWGSYFDIDVNTNGIGLSFDAFGHYAQISSQKGQIIDLDYTTFNWDPSNLSQVNPWYNAIYDGITPSQAPFDSDGDGAQDDILVNLTQTAFTHCGIILDFDGEILSGTHVNDSFDFDECYIRIKRYKGWDEHSTDDSSPSGGWDAPDNNGGTPDVNTWRNYFNNGKVYDSRPWTDPVGNSVEADGTLGSENGKTIADAKAKYISEEGANGVGESKWRITIPIQPTGRWLYKVQIYEPDNQETVWDSDFIVGYKYGINLPTSCGACVVDEANIKTTIKRNWGPPSDESEYWQSVGTIGGEEFSNPKWMYTDYAHSPTTYDVVTFGDMIPKFDGMYYLRGSNTFYVKGGNALSQGPSSVHFNILFGLDHSHLAQEAIVNGSPLGYTTNVDDPVPNYLLVDEGLSNGDVGFLFDACNLPEDGHYKIYYKIICDDTGIVQKEEYIDFYSDHAPPIIEDPPDQALLDGNNLSWTFNASDNQGLAFMQAIPQDFFEPEGYADSSNPIIINTPIIICKQCYFLDSGDEFLTGHYNVTEHTLDCSFDLDVDDMRRCICDGNFRMYAFAMDLAGNCKVKPFHAEIDGSRRGLHGPGVCIAPMDDGTIRPYGLNGVETTEGDGWANVNEEDCCLASGGTWNEVSGCIWSNAGSGPNWSWQDGICIDCLGNPISPFSSVSDQSTCESTSDPICTSQFSTWSTEDVSETTQCTTMVQEGMMDAIPHFGMVHPTHDSWGMAMTLPMCTFMNRFDCCECADGSEGCECCNLSCIKDVEANCVPANVSYNIIGPYFNHDGFPLISMVVTGIAWEGDNGWNSECGNHSFCEVCFTVKDQCCGTGAKKPAGDKKHCGYGNFEGYLKNGCCPVCPADEDSNIAPITTIGKNVALYYTPEMKRWDAVDVAPPIVSSNGSVLLAPTVGAVTRGKFGEQILSVEDRIYGFTEKINEKKSWLWHSKELDMGNSAATKIFKKVDIKANLFFADSVVGVENSSSLEYSDSNVIVLVDGIEVPITADYDETEIPDVKTYDEDSEKTFFNYVFKINKKHQKGKTISVRFANQPGISTVDSINVIYRSKPIK